MSGSPDKGVEDGDKTPIEKRVPSQISLEKKTQLDDPNLFESIPDDNSTPLPDAGSRWLQSIANIVPNLFVTSRSTAHGSKVSLHQKSQKKSLDAFNVSPQRDIYSLNVSPHNELEKDLLQHPHSLTIFPPQNELSNVLHQLKGSPNTSQQNEVYSLNVSPHSEPNATLQQLKRSPNASPQNEILYSLNSSLEALSRQQKSSVNTSPLKNSSQHTSSSIKPILQNQSQYSLNPSLKNEPERNTSIHQHSSLNIPRPTDSKNLLQQLKSTTSILPDDELLEQIILRQKNRSKDIDSLKNAPRSKIRVTVTVKRPETLPNASPKDASKATVSQSSSTSRKISPATSVRQQLDTNSTESFFLPARLVEKPPKNSASEISVHDRQLSSSPQSSIGYTRGTVNLRDPNRTILPRVKVRSHVDVKEEFIESLRMNASYQRRQPTPLHTFIGEGEVKHRAPIPMPINESVIEMQRSSAPPYYKKEIYLYLAVGFVFVLSVVVAWMLFFWMLKVV